LGNWLGDNSDVLYRCYTDPIAVLIVGMLPYFFSLIIIGIPLFFLRLGFGLSSWEFFATVVLWFGFIWFFRQKLKKVFDRILK